MSQKNNDSIEDFFRKGVRPDDDMAFMESDWKNMERMLDEQAMIDARAIRQSIRKIVAAVTGLMLILGLSTYLFVFRESEKSDVKQVEAPVTAGREEPSKESQKNRQDMATMGDASQDGASTPNPDQKGNTHVSSPEKNSLTPDEGPAVEQPVAENRQLQSQHPNISEDNGINKTTLDNIIRSSTVNPSTVSSSTESEDESANIEGFTAQPVQPEVIASNKSEAGKADEELIAITTDSAKTEVSTDESEVAPEKEKIIRDKRWNIALVLAPDFSVTGQANVSAPGEAFGVLLGYRFANRFTLSSGLLRTFKKYEGSGEDYHPPKGYWKNKTNGIIPDEIYGQCAVIEVPVWVQFDLKQKPKYRIYLTGGASGYRMLNESYRYRFNQPNEGAASGWSSSQASSYMLAVGHLSVGYERNVSDRFSIGLEPYVKTPFSGIGWSDVQIYTLGVYVNARYRF